MEKVVYLTAIDDQYGILAQISETKEKAYSTLYDYFKKNTSYDDTKIRKISIAAIEDGEWIEKELAIRCGDMTVNDDYFETIFEN